MSFLVLVRHSAVQVQPDVANRDWALSAEGRASARRLGGALRAAGPATDVVVASTEAKARATADELVAAWNGTAAVHVDERLDEVTRPWVADRAAYTDAVRAYFAGEDRPDWESRAATVRRVTSAIHEVAPAGATVVTHGLALTSYLASVVADLDALAFWSELSLPDAWAVELSPAFPRNIALHRVVPGD